MGRSAEEIEGVRGEVGLNGLVIVVVLVFDGFSLRLSSSANLPLVESFTVEEVPSYPIIPFPTGRV
jgi:hypothetical protein